MPIWSMLFTDKITSIHRVVTDGYGSKTKQFIYNNISCRYVEANVLSYNEVTRVNRAPNIIKETYKGIFYIDPYYDLIALEDIILFENSEYIIKEIQYKKPLLGSVQFVQLMVVDNGV